MRSMSAPSEAGVFRARYNDGQAARTVDVGVRIGPEGVTVTGHDGRLDHWPADTVRLIEKPSATGPLRLGTTERAGARLAIADEAAFGLCSRVLPQLHAAERQDRRVARRVMAWGVAAVAAVALIVTVLIPRLADQVAAMIPEETEQRLGAEVAKQVVWLLAKLEGRPASSMGCSGGEGGIALAQLGRRLSDAADVDRPVAIRLIDADLVNAFAVPGRRIILTRGMVEFAPSPEALAGVLAHEVAHGLHHHPMAMAVRTASTSFLLGLLVGDFLGGGAVVAVGHQMLEAGYNRDAEHEADLTAIELLRRAGIDPGPTGDLFDAFAARAGEMEGGALDRYFASHPPSAARAALFRDAATAGTPALPPRLWDALRRACD